ncbi:MAG: hypothetical protein HKN11_09250 [Rhizobiales bacterium]|nr:hypothetical protein [Hyphomicrobiales bacterium]
MRCLITLIFAFVLAIDTQQAFADPKCYVDRKKEVCFPLGVRSFADGVTSFFEGSPATKFATARVVTKTLGEPDHHETEKNGPEEPQNYLTLGCGGALTVQFRDNALIDVPGPDLYVFEVGKDVEATRLAISTNAKSWTDVGTIKGGLAAVDINRVATPGQHYRFVRLQDARKRCGSRWPGADIDAVGAIGSVAVANGRLSVAASQGLKLTPGRIGLIFDASGSMWGKLPSGKTKIAAARSVMRSLAAKLSDEASVGFRVYGHRLPSRPKDKSCRDSELVIPFGPLDRGQLVRAVENVKPKGQTPIGRSLALMSGDIGADHGFSVIVIVTDGIETCSPSAGAEYFPPAVVKSMQERGIKFRVNVVGFDIESSQTREFLTHVAETSGGSYFGASDASELEKALSGAIELVYLVQDQQGATVFEGAIGSKPVDLAPGRYSIKVLGATEFAIPNVDITQNVETRITVTEGGASPIIEKVPISSTAQ